MSLLLAAGILVYVGWIVGISRPPRYPDLRKRAAELESQNSDLRKTIHGWRKEWREARTGLTAIHRRERLMREAQLGLGDFGEPDSYENRVADTQGAFQTLLTESEKVLRGRSDTE